MESSNHRHTRAHSCCPPTTRAALLALLSDTEDATYPFFREGGDPDFVKTVTLGMCHRLSFSSVRFEKASYMSEVRTSFIEFLIVAAF